MLDGLAKAACASGLTARTLLAEFRSTLHVGFDPAPDLLSATDAFLNSLAGELARSEKERLRRLIGHVNCKFRFNSTAVNDFLATAAMLGKVFNYHDKVAINRAFDHSDARSLLDLLSSRADFDRSEGNILAKKFRPIPPEETIQRLHSELISPTLVRKDSKPRDWSQEILRSLFGAFVFSSYPEEQAHSFTDPIGRGQRYLPDFWEHLHTNAPNLFHRVNTFTAFRITQKWIDHAGSFEIARALLFREVVSCYRLLTNHGFLAFLIEPIASSGVDATWRLYADLVLFAEKHDQIRLRRHYFDRTKIEGTTLEYIKELEPTVGDFEVVAQGFHYSDCFVLGEGGAQRLLVLFQKNVADETLIPCPACRSHNVQGNSYSSFGVRSWECNNILCPDRTKFNRGKRYSFLQLLKQQAISEPANEIPRSSVRQWARDVQPYRTDLEVIEMLVRHYTLSNEGIALVEFDEIPDHVLTRRIMSVRLPVHASSTEQSNRFFSSIFFRRFLRQKYGPLAHPIRTMQVQTVTAVQADARDALRTFPPAHFDGAVTSPPYYNARKYSQWPNIYTYLYDMYNINREVFRCLKPGAVYLYNIFDYFDNENIVSLSAMGQKRMILGPYTVDIFQRIGFQIIGNIVWDKGEIEGKRGFNNGNFSPYYQAPFNCWEHVLVFQKPPVCAHSFPNLIRCKPVIKMVRGENRHGHTAPFPDVLPKLLISSLEPNMHGGLVLDPFAGSMTTGVVAMKCGHRAVCIEKEPVYFSLGVTTLSQSARQPHLI
jgi:DNA modification methylase